MEAQQGKRHAAVGEDLICHMCGRKFSKVGSRKSHKCREEIQRLVSL